MKNGGYNIYIRLAEIADELKVLGTAGFSNVPDTLFDRRIALQAERVTLLRKLNHDTIKPRKNGY